MTSLDGSATKTVTVTIHGTNDEPVITGQTTGSITEDATARTTGTLSVVDADTGQSGTTAASNVAVAHGTWSVDGSGHWSYKLNNADPAVQALVAGETLTDSFTVYSKDGSASQVITITINGRDDVPVISGEVTGNVVEDGTLIATGTLVVTDKDAGQSHALAASGTAKYGAWSIDADGQWSYQLDNGNAKVQALGVGKVLTDTFIVVSEDGLAQKTVKITITGSNDIPTIAGTATGAVTDGGVLKATGVLTISDLDAGQSSAKAVSNIAATYGTWSVTSGGRWTYQLDSLNPVIKALPIGQTLTDTFEVQSSDGSAAKLVTVTIAGGNHVATITGDTFGQVIEDNQLHATGTLVVSDADAGEAHTQAASNVTATYGTWSVDHDGHWSYDLDEDNAVVQSLGVGHSISDVFTISSLDGSIQQTVTINIGGWNDAPTTPVDGDAAENAIRASAAAGAAVGITLQSNDIDNDSVAYALTDDAGGRFQVNPLTGEVTVAAGAPLSAGTYTVTGIAWDGAAHSAPQSYTITVEEPNQATVLSSNVTAVAFSAATVDGWGVWIAPNGGAPVQVATFGSFPQYTMQVGNKLYFTGSDGQHGNELWSYDIATGRTHLAADIWAGNQNGNPAYLTELGGRFYFSAYDGDHGAELWVFDPATETASLAADIYPGSGGSSPQYLTAAGGKLYFEAYKPSNGGELWVYDPATQSASLASDVWPGASSSYPKFLTEIDGKLYFNAYDSTRGAELWIYNPATHSSSVVNIIPGTSGSYPMNFVALGGKLYFSAMDATFSSKLFVYNPATQTTSVAVGSPSPFSAEMTVLDGKMYFSAYVNGSYQLMVYNPVAQQTVVANDQPFAGALAFVEAIGGKLYFSSEDSTHGRELWVYDPVTGHSSVYADLFPGSHAQVSNQGVEVGGKVFFHAYDAEHGTELWAYDPATNTAQLVVDLWPGPNGTYENAQVALDGKLYFAGSDATSGTELWVYDPATGTAALAADVWLGGSSNPKFLTAVDGKLYFSADDGANGAELWVFDPATGTETLAVDILPGSMGASLQSLTAMDGKLYFNADDGVHGSQLWVYDPSAQSAAMLTEMGTSSWPMGSNPSNLTALGGKLYFNAIGEVDGRELWVYDPATGNTSLAADILSGPYDGNPQDIVVLDGKLYFRAYNDVIGTELWTYDPATGVASLVQDISQQAFGSFPAELTVLGGKLYFVASDVAHGNELRVYDPATDTVSLVADLSVGGGNSNPRHLTVNGDKLFFVASDGTGVDQFWTYDPMSHTTTLANVVGGTPNSSNPQQIAPVISNGLELNSISADPTSNQGSLVAAILGLHVTDANGDPHGVAIAGADTSHGDWQYSLDHGVTWITLGAVSDNAATLLDATSSIRFVPDAGWSGTAEITVRAWDQSDGHHSGDSNVDVSLNGGETAFSSAALDAVIDVTAIHAVNGSGNGETLIGTLGADMIDAGLGDDILVGGAGGDTLIGGAGADQFKYALTSHSTLSHLDVIGDFNASDGDSIDLRAIGLSGGITDGGLVGSFGSGPGSSFGGNGLIVETDGTNTRIYADSDHSGTFNANADMVIQLTGNHLNELVTQPAAILIA